MDVTENQKEMSFLDHLEELRWCILKALIALVLGMAICYFFSGKILNLLTAAVPEDVDLRTLRPTENFVTRLKIAFTSGVFVSLPYILYQVWQFIIPGLFENERKYLLPFLFFGSMAFLFGGAFAYFIVLPIAIGFLHSFQTERIVDAWAIGEYISFVSKMLIAFGMIFELPLISFILTKIGLINPQFLSSKRQYAVVIIFILAAILTPPDIFTQLMMAFPLILLYEVSIWISKIAIGKKDDAKIK